MSIILREIRRNLYIFFQGCKISEDLAPIVKASRRRVAKQWRRLAETLKSGFCLGLNLNTEKLSVYERICSKIKKNQIHLLCVTVVPAGTDFVIQVFPPIMQPLPITV